LRNNLIESKYLNDTEYSDSANGIGVYFPLDDSQTDSLFSTQNGEQFTNSFAKKVYEITNDAVEFIEEMNKTEFKSTQVPVAKVLYKKYKELVDLKFNTSEWSKDIRVGNILKNRDVTVNEFITIIDAFFLWR
jgi:hypothetical protein